MNRIFWILCMLLLATPCFAQSGQGAYVFVGPGLTFDQEDFDIPSYGGNTLIYKFRTDIDNGRLIAGGAGYQVNNFLRLEGEVAYRASDIDKLEVTKVSPIFGAEVLGGEGDIKSVSIMGNAWCDFPLLQKMHGYVGGGIGASRVELDDVILKERIIAPPFPVVDRPLVDDKTWSFAYQLGIGVAYDLTDHFSLDLGYRYFATNDPDFENVDQDKFSAEYKNSNVVLLLKYSL